MGLFDKAKDAADQNSDKVEEVSDALRRGEMGEGRLA